MSKFKFFLSKHYLTPAVIALSLMAGGSTMAETPINTSSAQLIATEIAAKYKSDTTYTVKRNDKKIGTHTISFSQENKELVVRVNSAIKVTVFKVPVYRLSYVSEERWLDNALISVTATTTENGEINTVTLAADGGNNPALPIAYSSNHWHAGVLKSNAVFNTLTGDISKITIAHVGMDQASTSAGVSVAANRYKYTGDIDADVWYDEHALWLKMRFIGEDGSVIEYIRNN